MYFQVLKKVVDLKKKFLNFWSNLYGLKSKWKKKNSYKKGASLNSITLLALLMFNSGMS